MTFISHDLTGQTNVKQSTDYSYTLNYQASSNQLKELTSLSANCSQFMRLQCKEFPLWDNGAGEMQGWWVNFDGQKMNNWPGVPVEDFGCQCGKGTFQYIPLVIIVKPVFLQCSFHTVLFYSVHFDTCFYRVLFTSFFNVVKLYAFFYFLKYFLGEI